MNKQATRQAVGSFLGLSWIILHVTSIFLPRATADASTHHRNAFVSRVHSSGHTEINKLSAEDIIAQMTEANRTRDVALQQYTAKRNYYAINLRLNKEATMQVQVQYEWPGKKSFKILSEDGSDTIRKSVFRPLMNGEVECTNPMIERHSALSSDNYRFTLLERTELNGRPTFVLEIVPLRKEKYLFYAQLWIDAHDFAVVKMRGHPAKMPSFWTRKVTLQRDFLKVHDYWLPARDKAESNLLIFGTAEIEVKHFDYELRLANHTQPAG